MQDGNVSRGIPYEFMQGEHTYESTFLFTSGFHVLFVSQYMRNYVLSALICQNPELHALLRTSKRISPPLKPSLHPGSADTKALLKSCCKKESCRSPRELCSEAGLRRSGNRCSEPRPAVPPPRRQPSTAQQAPIMRCPPLMNPSYVLRDCPHESLSMG